MSQSIEHERKFLLATVEHLDGYPSIAIVQGYLATTEGGEVRIRTGPAGQVLTVKGARRGAKRTETEMIIDDRDLAYALIEACDGRVVVKRRFAVEVPRSRGEIDHWVVDQYEGDNAGLYLAEFEYPPDQREPHRLELPSWIGREVTHLDRYYASRLSVRPYRAWTPWERDGEDPPRAP